MRASWSSCSTLVVAIALAVIGCSKKPAAQADGPGEIKVAGASDLVFVMDEIVKTFEAETHNKVVFIPGSSGKLAAQVKSGAPFDVFMSANIAFVEDAIAAGACLPDTKALYAHGRLVMWTREGGPELPTTLEGLADPKYTRIAIAQPEHAPYGAAAKQALEKVGIWPTVEGRLVYGSNIKDTMQMGETGNADVAIIALSLAKKSKGSSVEIPGDLHAPIAQGLAVCKAGNEKVARQFVAYLKTPAVKQLMASYGFVVPE
jgi:molybdate transport system substrate-binding protein